ncbi:MAG: NADPH-dependent 7-cyano-7-deazaguanine reductase QueF [Aquisalimonadaceae bacterium]
MSKEHRLQHGAPLGKAVAYDSPYDPGLLFAIARSESRERLGFGAALPFSGCDIWNAWEVSWLDAAGKPAVAWGEFRVPAETPNIIESKSLKLYLNSLNQERLGSLEAVKAVVERDLSAVAGAPVIVNLTPPERWPDRLRVPEGRCLDDLPVVIRHYHPEPALLVASGEEVVEECLYSNLLRSLCPVTGQPDWGGIMLRYRGPAIDCAGLLAYIVSFRQHQDFHEQCAERMFRDIMERCRPEALTIHARYLRRGGLDINPFRTNTSEQPDNGRWFLQ